MSRLYIPLAIVAVIGSLVGWAYVVGRTDGRAYERELQHKATMALNNALAASQAKSRTLERLRLTETRKLSTEVDELRRQANEDPDANRPAMGLDSVRRLNAVR